MYGTCTCTCKLVCIHVLVSTACTCSRDLLKTTRISLWMFHIQSILENVHVHVHNMYCQGTMIFNLSLPLETIHETCTSKWYTKSACPSDEYIVHVANSYNRLHVHVYTTICMYST